MVQPTLYFGIDFGTTFSGVSWVYSGEPSEIHMVTNWPTKLYANSNREKTPTEFCIDTAPDGEEQITWGYNVPVVSKPFRWFKLLLADDDQLPEHLRTSEELNEARQMMQREYLDPVGLVAKYLRELWEFTVKSVQDTMSKNAVNECRFHIVLTVPAIWKDAARQKMTDAAETAGLLVTRRAGPTTLDLISEPEAGAIATFSSMEGRPDIAKGDSFLVVDAGGGTVDLISYTVESMSPFRLGECVEGSGGLCGGVFLDQSFETFLRNRLTPAVWDEIPAKALKKFLNVEWEHGIKQEFDGVNERSFILDLPNSCSEIFEDCELVLEHGHVKEIFDHVVEDINSLVWTQIKGTKARVGIPPKYVILIGGFGRSRYVGTSIRNLVDPTKTSVLQATGSVPWTAVCRGAVLHGLSSDIGSARLPVQVSSRISRAHYGITMSMKFQEGVHDERDRFWDTLGCVYRAWFQMDWYVLKGNKTSTMTPTTKDYHTNYRLDEHPLEKQIQKIITIYTSTVEPAPSRLLGSMEIKKVWDIRVTCPVKFGDLPVIKNQQGVKIRRWNFQIKVVANGSSASFEVYQNTGQGIGVSKAKLIGSKRIYMGCEADLEEMLEGLSLA